MGKSNIRFRDAKDLYFVDESEVLTVECSLAKGSIGLSLAIDDHPSFNLPIDLYDGLATIPVGDILRAAGQRNRSNPCFITITATCDGVSATMTARCVFCRRFSDDESVIFSSWLCSCGSQKVTYRSAPEILPFLADPSAATQSALIRISFLDGTSSDYTFADLRNMTVDGLDVSPKAVAEFASGKGVKKEIVSYDLWIIRESSSGARTTGKPCSFKIAKDRIERVTYKFLNQKGAFEYIHASGELRRSIDARTKTFISPGSESELSNDSSVIMEQNAGHIGSRSGAATWLDFLSSSRRYVVDKSMAEHLIVVEDNKSETLDFGVGEISFRWRYGAKSVSRADSATVPLESLRQRCDSVINTPLNRVRIDVDYEPSYTNQRGVIWRIVDGSEFVSLNSDGILRVKEGAHGSRVTILAQSVHDGSITDLKSYTVSYNTQAPSYPMTIEANVESPVVDLIIDDSEVNYEDGILIREGQLVTLRVSKPGYNTQSRSFEFSATEKSQYFYLVRHFQSDDYVSESTVKALISEGISSLDWFISETYEENGETRYRLKLNPKYVGMYAEGWVSAGGVSDQGGGGGGTGYLRDLLDVNASMSPAQGQALVWDDALGKWTAGDVSVDLTPFERIANRVTTVSSSSNHAQYPTAKAVYDIVNTMLPLTGGTMANTNLVTNLNADLLDGKHASEFVTNYGQHMPTTEVAAIGYGQANDDAEWATYGPVIIAGVDPYKMLFQSVYNEDALLWKRYTNGTYGSWKQIAFTDSNIASATKLQTARSIWGQSFDGSADVSGSLEIFSTGSSWCEGIRIHPSNNLWGGIVLCENSNSGSTGTSANTWSIHNNEGTFGMYKNGSTTSASQYISNVNNTWLVGGGNVGIGTTPAYRLDVSGDSRTSGKVYIGTNGGYLEVVNVGTTASPVYALKSSLPFFSDSWVSAGGVSSTGSGGGITGYLKDLLDVNGSMAPVDGQALVWDSSLGDNGRWTSKNVSVDLTPFERTVNKVTSISASSTDGQYPSARAVYNAMGNYLPLTGGTVRGLVQIDGATASGPQDNLILYDENAGTGEGAKIRWRSASYQTGLALLGRTDIELFYREDSSKNRYVIWDSGNDGSGSGLDADLLDGHHNGDLYANGLRDYNNGGTPVRRTVGNISYWDGALHYHLATFSMTDAGRPGADGYIMHLGWDNERWDSQLWVANADVSASQAGAHIKVRHHNNGEDSSWGNWHSVAMTDSNVASATKLETARKLWGNDFDGTSDVKGSLEIFSTGGSYNEGIRIHPASNGWSGVVFASSDNTGSSGTTGNTWGIHNNEGRLILSKGGTSKTPCLTNVGGNWGIDTYTPAYKFDINGIIRAEKLIGTATGITETSLEDEEFTYQATPVHDIADGYRIDRIKGNTIVSDGELINNSAEAIETTGFNQWDEVVQAGYYGDDGVVYSHQGRICGVNDIPVFPGTTYTLKQNHTDASNHWHYNLIYLDAGKGFISSTGWLTASASIQITTPSNCRYVRISSMFLTANGSQVTSISPSDYTKGTCFNISDSSINGTYEPYWNTRTAIGLNSIRVKDSNGNILEINGLDGAEDVYDEIKGRKLTKKFVKVDMGDLIYGTATIGGYNRFHALLPYIAARDGWIFANLINNGGYINDGISIGSNSENLSIGIYSNNYIYLRNDSYTDATSFKAAMKGVYLVFELATPVTYELVSSVPLSGRIDGNGTMRVISDGPVAPFRGDITYGCNPGQMGADASSVKSYLDTMLEIKVVDGQPVLHSKLPLYSDSWISAGGLSDTGEEGGATYLKNLLDVDDNLVESAGYGLVYDGTQWTSEQIVPASRKINGVTLTSDVSLSLGSLSNVSVTGATNGQQLIYNGSEWIAGVPAGAKFFHGTCSTSSSSNTKVVDCPSFTSADLVAGTAIAIVMQNRCDTTSTVTVNVNGTGANTLLAGFANRKAWSAQELILAVYDGSGVWDMLPTWYYTYYYGGGGSGGGGGTGSTVVVHPSQISEPKIEIATISVDGTGYKLFAPSVSVSQTQGSTGGTQIASINSTAIYAPAVTVTQVQTSGVEVARIKVGSANPVSIFAPSGSSGSSGVQTVVGRTGDVTTDQIATALTNAGHKLTDTVQDLSGYLPLTAGSSKALTNTLYTRGLLPTANASYDLGSLSAAYNNTYTKRVYLADGVYIEYDSTNRCVYVHGAGIATDSFVSAGGVSTTSN